VLPAQIRNEDDQLRFRASNLEVTIRFRDNRVKPLGDQIRDAVSGGLAHYTRIFGGAPRAADGTPAVRLTINVAIDRLGGGETEPGVVSLLVARDPVLGFYDWKLALLHETFHLWNTASFRHASPAEQWFAEGTAEFYAAQAAARIGLLDEPSALRAAGTVVQAYAAGAEGAPSLMQAGRPAEGGSRAVNHAGWTAALVLDRSIRERTGNEKSLDDLMLWLFSNYNGAERPYATLDLVRGVRDATGADVMEFFARHVLGRLPLPLAETPGLAELASGGTVSDALVLHSIGVRPAG
jgi:predicted metalloprotease with PDZ domain